MEISNYSRNYIIAFKLNTHTHVKKKQKPKKKNKFNAELKQRVDIQAGGHIYRLDACEKNTIIILKNMYFLSKWGINSAKN